MRVVVRCRPLFGKELKEERKSIAQIHTDLGVVSITDPATGTPKDYTFDGAYPEDTVQKNFYEECMYGLVEQALLGFNATVFAYGQTGAGKTHTMLGKMEPAEQRGVIPNSFEHIFESVAAMPAEQSWLVQVGPRSSALLRCPDQFYADAASHRCNMLCTGVVPRAVQRDDPRPHRDGSGESDAARIFPRDLMPISNC